MPINGSNDEGSTDSDKEEDIFDYIKAEAHNTEDKDPEWKKLEGNIRTVASKAVNAYRKVMKVYLPKGKSSRTRSKLPSILSHCRKRFENILRSPNPIDDDTELYLVRTLCNI